MRNPVKKSGQSGFTLVEMAVVMLIMGLVLASAAQLFTQWVRFQRTETTRMNVENAVAQITAYRDIYGHYPCPAPLTASRDIPTVGSGESYGAQTQCTNNTGDYALGAGVTAAGIAGLNSAQGIFAYSDISTTPPTPAPSVPRVRIGALPFRTLNMDENQSYDGYQNRLFYAVTEQLTDGKLFNPRGGGIQIINDQDTTAVKGATNIDPLTGLPVTDSDTANFIIFSAGEDAAGAYTRYGNRLPCAATGLEAENCDFTTDTEFRVAMQGTAGEGTAQQFDDVVAYATHKDVPLWEVGADPNEIGPVKSNMTMKVPGGVGIGPNAAQNPNEKLAVEGIVAIQDDPNTTGVQEGNVEAASICDYTSGTTTCFPSSLIAGDLDASPPTGGMKCPAGQFMVGIKNSQPICKDEIIVTCPGNQVMTGMNANGTLICSGPPPGGCITETRQICGSTQTLFAAAHNTTQTLTGGISRQETYRCRNGNWQQRASSGICTCTPVTNPPTTQSCANWSGGCGATQSGTMTVQSSYICPSGTWQTNVISSANCNCIPSSQTRTQPCAAGFNSGVITETNTNICGPAPSCSGWIQTGNTCACNPTSQQQTLQCPPGESGQIVQRQDFACPGGSASPGSWGKWTTISNTCAPTPCNPSSYTSPENCPLGQVGNIIARYTQNCPIATNPVIRTEVSNTCTVPPPVVCKWKIQGSGTTQNFAMGINDGDTCNCGSEKGSSKSCSAPIGNGQHRMSSCICQ